MDQLNLIQDPFPGTFQLNEPTFTFIKEEALCKADFVIASYVASAVEYCIEKRLTLNIRILSPSRQSFSEIKTALKKAGHQVNDRIREWEEQELISFLYCSPQNLKQTVDDLSEVVQNSSSPLLFIFDRIDLLAIQDRLVTQTVRSFIRKFLDEPRVDKGPMKVLMRNIQGVSEDFRNCLEYLADEVISVSSLSSGYSRVIHGQIQIRTVKRTPGSLLGMSSVSPIYHFQKSDRPIVKIFLPGSIISI